jgi:hypothetical protein
VSDSKQETAAMRRRVKTFLFSGKKEEFEGVFLEWRIRKSCSRIGRID